ncbi:MAG: signal peptidase II [Endomicrobium sp.]|jgi:signal peptidase II|nr:signal peptidase II [Endomicrobium sp.]
MLIAIIAMLILILIDQIIKYFVICYIPYSMSINCIYNLNLLNFIHARNSGLAFGILKQYNNKLVLISFIGISLIIILGYFFKFWSKLQTMNKLSLCMIISGGTSNLIDRFIYNAVIDFIDFGVNKTRYPVFNIADIYLCIGFILIASSLLVNKKQS